MARIEPTRGPHHPQRGPEGGKVSPELRNIRDLVIEVAANAHLHRFESTRSTFSEHSAGDAGKTREAVREFFKV